MRKQFRCTVSISNFKLGVRNEICYKEIIVKIN